MPLIVERKPRTQQPLIAAQVDRENAFGASAALVLLPSTVHSLRGAGWTSSGTLTTGSRSRNADYYGAAFLTKPWGAEIRSQAMTLFAVVSTEIANTASSPIIGVFKGGATGLVLGVHSNFAGTEYPAILVGNATNGSTAYQLRKTTRVAVLTTNGSNNHNLYVGGELALNRTDALGTFDTSWSVGVGRVVRPSFAADNANANMNVALAGILSRELSANEVAQFSANPWQLFVDERRIWVPSAGGGASVISSAAGIATASTLAGSSVAASNITAATGAATTSALAGASIATAGFSAAAGAATASALTGVAGSGSTISAAAGVATTSALTGSSVAVAAFSAAAGTSTASAATGSSVAVATFGTAAGASTTATLNSAAGASAITPASGLASASVIAGSSIVVSAFSPAAGVATTSTLANAAATIIPTMPPYIAVYMWRRTA